MNPVRLARELIRMDTTNPPGGEEEALRLLAGVLEPAGFEVGLDQFAPGRASLVARLRTGGSAPEIAFAGHVDTVPVGEKPWRLGPFSGLEENGQVHGRGASDMKGGIAAICCAGLEAARMGLRKNLSLFVFGGEESGCEGSFHVADNPALLGRPEAVVVAEPTRNRPLVGHKGAFWLQGTARGKTAHGSMPELGDNALYKAAEAVVRLKGFDFKVDPHAQLGGPTLSVNTLAAGQNVNSVPDMARFSVDIRSIPGQSHARLLEELVSLTGPECVFATLLDIPAVWTDPAHAWVRQVFSLLAERIDPPPGIETVQFFTDAAAFRRALPKTPILVLGPGDPAQAHQTDEWCEAGEIHAATRMFVDIISHWPGR